MEQPTAPIPEGLEGPPHGLRRWSGWLRSLVLPLLILAAIVGGLVWFENRGSGPTVEEGGFGVVELPTALNVTGRPPVAAVGRAAPNFLLQTIDGGSLRLSDLQGRPIVLNFWATWCRPCRDEVPELVSAYGAHRQEGLVIVGLNLQEADARVQRFAAEFGMVFPVVIDRTGQVADVWRLGGPIEGIPTTYFIDERGVIQDFFYGPMTAKILDERLTSILGGGS